MENTIDTPVFIYSHNIFLVWVEISIRKFYFETLYIENSIDIDSCVPSVYVVLVKIPVRARADNLSALFCKIQMIFSFQRHTSLMNTINKIRIYLFFSPFITA